MHAEVQSSRFRFMLPGGSKHSCATEVADAGRWYHLVGVWNGTAVGIYRNGQHVESAATEGLTLDTSSLSAEPARIGPSARVDDRSELDFRGLIERWRSDCD